MLRVCFSPGRDRGCRHCWISSLDPREIGWCSFRVFSEWKPLSQYQNKYLLKVFFRQYLINIKNKLRNRVKPPDRAFLPLQLNKVEFIKKQVEKQNAPWQETFADAGDGDGGGPIGAYIRTTAQ